MTTAFSFHLQYSKYQPALRGSLSNVGEILKLQEYVRKIPNVNLFWGKHVPPNVDQIIVYKYNGKRQIQDYNDQEPLPSNTLVSSIERVSLKHPLFFVHIKSAVG